MIPFKIPAYSRSILTPSGVIYLIGGEDPNTGAKNTVYKYDLNQRDNNLNLKQVQSMPIKKFDFSLSYLDDFIYVVCGKDASSDIVGSCERFNLIE